MSDDEEREASKEYQTLAESGRVEGDPFKRAHPHQKVATFLRDIAASMRAQTQLMEEQTELLRVLADRDGEDEGDK